MSATPVQGSAREATRREIAEIHRKVDEALRIVTLLAERLNVSTVPLSARGAHTGVDGVRHLPGSQPFGTRTPEVAEEAPLEGAGPSTAREALKAAQNGSEREGSRDGVADL